MQYDLKELIDIIVNKKINVDIKLNEKLTFVSDYYNATLNDNEVKIYYVKLEYNTPPSKNWWRKVKVGYKEIKKTLKKYNLIQELELKLEEEILKNI